MNENDLSSICELRWSLPKSVLHKHWQGEPTNMSGIELLHQLIKKTELIQRSVKED